MRPPTAGCDSNSDDARMQTQAPRKIIHCDCDCFYAAVEIRDNPRLAGRPLAVGGSPQRRGVVATCNYEARALGIRSAMAMAQALRRCPDLVVLPPDFPRYRQAAEQIRGIFREFTDLVEPLSLDEAFLDVSDSRWYGGSATRIAAAIRAQVRAKVGLTVSAGVAPNKFLAKIASDWRKPDGLFVIPPAAVDDFVRALPVRRLFGVGAATADRLDGLGVSACGELREVPLSVLLEHFGAFGRKLYERCRGIDERPVEPDRRRQSLSVERTFACDLVSLESCLSALDDLYAELAARLRRLDPSYVVRGSLVKLRFDDFATTTLERRQPGGTDLAGYRRLCAAAWRRRRRPVRLLGLGVRLADRVAAHQEDLFGSVIGPSD